MRFVFFKTTASFVAIFWGILVAATPSASSPESEISSPPITSEPLSSVASFSEPRLVTLDDEAGNDSILENNRTKLEGFFKAVLSSAKVPMVAQDKDAYWSGESGSITITSQRYRAPNTNVDFRIIELRIRAVWRPQTSNWRRPITIYQATEIAWHESDFRRVTSELLEGFALQYHQSKNPSK
jgi:zona occludens toxin (predicted ATPase)